MKLLVGAYRLIILAGTLLSHVFLLAIRLRCGWDFFETGKGKLQHLDKITEFFASLHIPMPHFNAILAGSTECFGGLLLLLGLGARLVSIPLTFIMFMAYMTADHDSLQSFDLFVKSDPFPFLFTVLVVLCFGPGKISIDYLIKCLFFPKSEAKLG